MSLLLFWGSGVLTVIMAVLLWARFVGFEGTALWNGQLVSFFSSAFFMLRPMKLFCLKVLPKLGFLTV